VQGAGTYGNEYVISASSGGLLGVQTTDTIALDLNGTGESSNPYLLTAYLQANIDELDDVSQRPPQLGQVLAWNGTQWEAAAPSVAPAGSVRSSGCIDGDGTAQTPLVLLVDPNGGLACGGLGLTLSDASQVKMTTPSGRTDSLFTFADLTQTKVGTDTAWSYMPHGTHNYITPSWAQSAEVDFETRDMNCVGDTWAAAVGRMIVRRASTGDTNNPLFGAFTGTGGQGMYSGRAANQPTGTSIGFRELRKISNLVAGENIALYGQVRSAAIAGNGTFGSRLNATMLMSKITWSDQP
jgi:hypothetical protein